MVTMKWTVDELGRPVPAWKTEAPTVARAKQFGAGYHKAVRLTTSPRHPARGRSGRTLTLLAATTTLK